MPCQEAVSWSRDCAVFPSTVSKGYTHPSSDMLLECVCFISRAFTLLCLQTDVFSYLPWSLCGEQNFTEKALIYSENAFSPYTLKDRKLSLVRWITPFGGTDKRLLGVLIIGYFKAKRWIPAHGHFTRLEKSGCMEVLPEQQIIHFFFFSCFLY